MYRLSLAVVALSATLAAIGATTGAALAQTYPPSAYYPAYNQPYYGYAPQYGAAPATPGYYYPGPYGTTHSGGGTSRAYSYWGAQKSN
ncbi:MAG TPA: hypothetical protein VG651_10145 [Stellaceae bacterium]|nr:hypothetical protein [Stellaceae bacterium]